MTFRPFDDLSNEVRDNVLTVLSMIVTIDKNRAHERYSSKRLNHLAQRYEILGDRPVFAVIFHTFKNHVECIHAMLCSLESDGHGSDIVLQKELEAWSVAFAEANLLMKVANSECRELTVDYQHELNERFAKTFEKLGGEFFRMLDEAELERTYKREIWATDIFRVPNF